MAGLTASARSCGSLTSAATASGVQDSWYMYSGIGRSSHLEMSQGAR
jgi:hypothetical protein